MNTNEKGGKNRLKILKKRESGGKKQVEKKIMGKRLSKLFFLSQILIVLFSKGKFHSTPEFTLTAINFQSWTVTKKRMRKRSSFSSPLNCSIFTVADNM